MISPSKFCSFTMDVQQLFTNLGKEAECPLCLEVVTNPKTLPCIHSFCLKCLDKLAGFARRQLQTNIKCPVCQTSFQIPEGDSFKTLPTSFHLNRLVDVLALKDGSTQAQKCSNCDENYIASCYCFVCQTFLCTTCFEAHQRMKASRGHRNVVIENLQAQDVEELIHRPAMCSQQYHENQPLEFYCEDCKVPVCHKCSVVSHNRHTMTDTQKATQVLKMQMKDALQKVKAETVTYENQIRTQTELMDKTRNEIITAEKEMTDVVEECISNLREHERVMKAKFAEIYEAQQKHHATRLENFELVLTQLKSCVERGENIVKRNVSAEILQTKEIIVGRCEELLNVTKPEIYAPPHVHYLVENQRNILDRIVVSNTDPFLSLAEMGNQKDVRERTETNCVIVTRNSDGRQCYHKDDQIKVDISTPAGDQLETEITDTKDGKYIVTYTPQCVGQHRVEIQVNGEPLTGSPWVVQVIPPQYQFAFQFGSKGKEQGQFELPCGIAVSERSRMLAVVNLDNGRIQMFSFEGNFVREIAQAVAGTCGVAFTESGDLLVGISRGQHKLCMYTEDGKFTRYISDELVKTPCYISVRSDGRIITCDIADKTIKVLSSDGKYLLQSFSAPGCDAAPWCVVHHQDKFFVSYPSADRVMVFNNEGMHLHDIGSVGFGDGQLRSPVGLAVDKFNRLIICDTGNRRLQVFTLDGKYVCKVAGSFSENISLYYCATSSTGHLFVTDIEKHCIHVFSRNITM